MPVTTPHIDRQDPADQPDQDDERQLVTQQASRVYLRHRDRLAEPARADAGDSGSVTLGWVKFRHRWCNLFSVDLSHAHFEDVGGVYVAWHNGVNPVVCVGQGQIRDRLTAHRQDPDIFRKHHEKGLFVTWARLPEKMRDGVERYLIDMLNPAIVSHLPRAEPIQVNLPR